MSAQLGLGESIDLAHVLTHHVLADAGVRALFVKGPAARAHGFRPPSYVSSDVDVLCDPAEFTTACSAAEAAGWQLYPGNSRDSHLLGAHATTYVVPGWPSTVDLHNHFPGLLAPPQEVFETLWAAREEIAVAHLPTPVPRPSAHFVVLAVNCLRSTAAGVGEQLPELGTAWSSLTSSERVEAVAIARTVGALEPLRGAFAALGADAGAVDPRFRRGLRAWHAFRADPGDSGGAWLGRVGSRPWRDRPAHLLRAVWDVNLDHSRTPEEWAAAGPLGRSLARVDRARRGGLAVARMTSARLRRPRGGGMP